MFYVVLYLPIVLPILFWAWYHWHKDRHLPEPPGHLLTAYLLGVASCYIAMFMYQGLEFVNLREDAYLLAESDRFSLFRYSILAIGGIEEVAKMIPFLLVVIRFREFDEPIDGIIYASFIALGFASVENIQYMQNVPLWEALGRGFAGPVVHIVFASIWGYFIGRAYLCKRPLIPVIAASLLFTAVLHGFYDYLVIAMPPWALPMAACLIASAWIWRLSLIRDLHTLPAGPCPFDELTPNEGSEQD